MIQSIKKLISDIKKTPMFIADVIDKRIKVDDKGLLCFNSKKGALRAMSYHELQLNTDFVFVKGPRGYHSWVK